MEQQTTQVLVVDDNPEIRDIIHVLLEGEGIRVTEAADGASALHFLEKCATLNRAEHGSAETV